MRTQYPTIEFRKDQRYPDIWHCHNRTNGDRYCDVGYNKTHKMVVMCMMPERTGITIGIVKDVEDFMEQLIGIYGEASREG
jgi:hypothetical protein